MEADSNCELELYREIAAELRCKTKSVDNALARIKRKVATIPVGDADLTEIKFHRVIA